MVAKGATASAGCARKWTFWRAHTSGSAAESARPGASAARRVDALEGRFWGGVDTPLRLRIFRANIGYAGDVPHAGPTVLTTVIRDVILLGSTTCVFIGTVLRMWDSIAEADKDVEFHPRTSSEELHDFFRFFTMLDRYEHAVAPDRFMYYLRTAQACFSLRLVPSVPCC